MNPYDILFYTFAFFLGACIGSFLNVCIYRMPLNLSVNEPKRSFCPSCKYQIPWHHNLPLISWLALRGKCGNCGSKISFRYFGVELLTGIAFLIIWHWSYKRAWIIPNELGGPAAALALWIMVSLLIVATFIDFEHIIIPDEITWGGAMAGIGAMSLVAPLTDRAGNGSQFFAGLVGFIILISGFWLARTIGGPIREMRSPKLFFALSFGGIAAAYAVNYVLGARSSAAAIVHSTIGAVAGYWLVWGVVEGGKIAFGKKVFRPKSPTPFTWTIRSVQGESGEEKDADLVVGDTSWKKGPRPSVIHSILNLLLRPLVWVGLREREEVKGESWVWSEIFYRPSDLLIMKCKSAAVDGVELGESVLKFTYDRLKVGDREWELDKIEKITGVVISLVVPREAMGYGDVKFMACIGAFLGWKGVLFTMVAASMIGAVVGVSTIAIGKREWSARIPFGPYLSVGAMIWLFTGPRLVAWYWELTHPPI
jgi:leader peptidase (prepilin peptidase)/N-methyltransferase